MLRLVGALFCPDYTQGTLDRRPPCSDIVIDKKDRAWVCSRRRDHTGRHAFGDGDIILAVWPRLEDL